MDEFDRIINKERRLPKGFAIAATLAIIIVGVFCLIIGINIGFIVGRM